ncbi:MAG: hypothetical protein AAGH64_11365 [Planctomycetota bacterium]
MPTARTTTTALALVAACSHASAQFAPDETYITYNIVNDSAPGTVTIPGTILDAYDGPKTFNDGAPLPGVSTLDPAVAYTLTDSFRDNGDGTFSAIIDLVATDPTTSQRTTLVPDAYSGNTLFINFGNFIQQDGSPSITDGIELGSFSPSTLVSELTLFDLQGNELAGDGYTFLDVGGTDPIAGQEIIDFYAVQAVDGQIAGDAISAYRLTFTFNPSPGPGLLLCTTAGIAAARRRRRA